MFQPLVSIIIPIYNREALIKQALNSVIAQTYANWECIVVDDGSTDDTLSVLEIYQNKDARISYCKRLREPKGAPTCRNIGLEHAKGDYIIYLDSDDYLLPFCLEHRVHAITKNKGCDFLVFPMGKQEGDAIIKVEIPGSENYLIPFLSANLPWQTMCPIWKTHFLKEIGGFTEGYPRFNDPELMIRALIQPNSKMEVLCELDFDSVFIPSIKIKEQFVKNIYYSLLLFIPDICKLLKQDNLKLKRLLAYYLHYWFKYVYVPSGKRDIWKSLNLIYMFNQNKILSFSGSINLGLRLLLFGTSSIFLSKPINKLCVKSIYK